MNPQSQSEKLGYIISRLEELQRDLSDHMAQEKINGEGIHKRLSDIESDHTKWKTIYWVFRGGIVLVVGALAIEWSNIGKFLRRIIGWEEL